MDGAPTKRGRGRPRKNPIEPTRADPETETETEAPIILDESVDDGARAELEAELQRAMDSPDGLDVVREQTVDDYTRLLDDPPVIQSRLNCNEPVAAKPPKPVKKMTSTTRKLMKFGYSQVLRASDAVSKGKIPGERMAYILANDAAADALLDEILNDLDQKYKVEQYLGPESKLALFTMQLFIQGRAENSGDL